MLLDVFVFVVLAVIIAAIAFIVVKLGGLPGKIAKSRSHPKADAINVCAWLGLITLGVVWPISCSSQTGRRSIRAGFTGRSRWCRIDLH